MSDIITIYWYESRGYDPLIVRDQFFFKKKKFTEMEFVILYEFVQRVRYV